MALIKPREIDPNDDSLVARPPLPRTVAMIVLGTAVAIWAIGSLASADDPAEESGAAPTAASADPGLAVD